MNKKEIVVMRELLDAADLFARKGNASAAMACQSAKTKKDIEEIILKHGTNFRLKNAIAMM